uniref:Inner centromere protein ARK-binding domain-containing protein n=1 Tax=Chenopodium quinoa TaxID=63459 RepID=A0A803MWM1_CHEQI
MSTIEKLFVQIFDRKRQIIEKLNHQKQLYDQHLLSKLLIQGIPPPSWLLNSDNQSSTSDLTALNKEELISGLLLPRPGPFASYTSGPSFLYDQPVVAEANSGIPDETCAGKCASSNGFDEDSVAPLHHVDGTEDVDGIVPPCHVDGAEDMADTIPPCHVDGTEDRAGIVPPCHIDDIEDTVDIVPPSHVDDGMDTFSYVPMSPEDQIDTRFSNVCKPEQSLARIQRSRSRQKALELRNSAKASTKSRLGMENDVGSFHDGKICRYDEQFDLKRSLELDGPSASPIEFCSNEEVAIGNCSNKEDSVDACVGFLAQATGFDPLIFSKEEAVTENSTHKEKIDDALDGLFTHSTVSEAKEVDLEDNQKIEENSNIYGNRITRSKGSCQQLGGSFSNSTDYGAKEVEMGDNQKIEEHNIVYGGRITRSRSSSQQTFDGAHPLNVKSVDVCVGQVTRTKSGLTQQVETSIGNSSKPCSGKITSSKDDEAEERETRFWRSMSREVSVKPKQLDFDEVEEGNLGDIPSHLSDSVSQDILEERARANTKSSTYPGISSSRACPESLEYEAHGVLGSEIAHQVNSKSDKTPGQSLILQHCGDVLHSSFDTDTEEVARPSRGRTPVGSLKSVTDFAPSVEMVQSGSLCNIAAVRASSSSHEKQVGGSKLFELGAEVNMLPNFNCRDDMDNSWPCYKRRKIEYQNPNKSSSPTLRTSSYKAISESVSNISAWGEKENIFPLPQEPSISHNSGAALSDCAILIKVTDHSVPSLPSKEQVLTPQVGCGKDKASLGRIDSSSAHEHQKLSKSDVSNVNQSIIAEPSDLTWDGKVETNASTAATCRGRVSGGLVNHQDLVDSDTVVKLMDTKMAVDHRNSHHKVHEFKLSIGSPLMECMKVAEVDQTIPGFLKVAEVDQTIPEFDRFVIGENTVDAQSYRDKFTHEEAPILDNKVDRNSLSEIICKSATFGTPVSPFTSGCKMYLAPGIYSSVPNGLLENIDLPSNLLPSGSAFLGKSHSDLFSFPGRQYGWEIKKPFLSPVGKGFEGATSKSASSDKLGSSNLELTCFPIQEDPESGEEEVNDAVNTGVEKNSSTMKNSTNIEPSFDITLQSISSLAPDHADERDCLDSVSTDVKRTDSSTGSGVYKESSCDIALQNESFLAPDDADKRCSQGSGSTEIGTFETHNDSKKSSMGQKRSMQTRFGKENNGFSVGAYSSKKHSKPHSSRFSKSKLSGKLSLRSRGQSLSEKEQKRTNIVSNIKSFVPLVQQKLAAAVLPEKRDVKVKALQAAEAAKRAAEIRENERNQKKEAMKLERARHKQAEDKLQAWNEDSRCAPEEGRAHQRKDFNEKTEKQLDKGYEREDSEKAVNNLVVGSDRGETDDGLSTLIDHKMSTGSSAVGKVSAVDVAESSTPNVDNDKPTHRTSAPQSYDISPYQCSDDEEDEVDRIQNKKFVPTWASKSCVSLAVSSLQHVDPDLIFPPGCFCSLEEGKVLYMPN